MVVRVLSFGRSKPGRRQRHSSESTPKPDAAIVEGNVALLESDEVAKGWLAVRFPEEGGWRRGRGPRVSLFAVFHKQAAAPPA